MTPEQSGTLYLSDLKDRIIGDYSQYTSEINSFFNTIEPYLTEEYINQGYAIFVIIPNNVEHYYAVGLSKFNQLPIYSVYSSISSVRGLSCTINNNVAYWSSVRAIAGLVCAPNNSTQTFWVSNNINTSFGYYGRSGTFSFGGFRGFNYDAIYFNTRDALNTTTYECYTSVPITYGSGDNFSCVPNLFRAVPKPAIQGITEDIIKFGPSNEIPIIQKYKGEKGRFIKLLDTGSYGTCTFTNLDYNISFETASVSSYEIEIPDSVFTKPGLVEVKIYGTGAQSSTVQKKIWLKVNDVPNAGTAVTPTSSVSPLEFNLNNDHMFEFEWKEYTTYPRLKINSETEFRDMLVWSDHDPSKVCVVSGNNNVFVIPYGYSNSAHIQSDKGTFHALLRFGDGTNQNTVAAEFKWNFEVR